MAPECMAGWPRSCQSDVYSFGNLAFAVRNLFGLPSLSVKHFVLITELIVAGPDRRIPV